jgi:hypothetical protein
MSIKGSKSKFAVREGIPGIENTQDLPIHVTAQAVPGERIALDVVSHGVYEVSNTGVIGAASVKRLIQSVAHGAKAGDIIKMTSGNSLDAEIPIIEIVDADFFVIPYEADIAVADTFNLLRHVTPKYAADGSTSVTITSAPTQFILDGNPQQVVEDTVAPANNRAMPNKLFVEIDGVQYAVSKDTGTPANTVSVPVEITGAAGPINITAGDLNVQLTDLGANFDRTRIGNGTNQWEMNASGEGLVHDADALAELQTISAIDFATEATLANIEANQTNGTQKTIITDGAGDVNTKQLGTALLNTDIALITTTTIHGLNSSGGGSFVDVKVNPSGKLLVAAEVTASALPTDAATETTLTNVYNELVTSGNEANTNALVLIDEIGAKNETAPATDTASSGLNGRLQRIAQRLTSLIALFPSSIGQKAKADSLSVTLASDQGALETKQKALTNTFDEYLTLTTVQTFTAPANAIGGKIQALSDNGANIRYKQGGTATTTSGIRLEPGRSEDFTGGSNITVVSESGTNAVSIQWTVQ